MDEIIWNSESLQLIATALREASDGMEADIVRLRRCRNEAPLSLRDAEGDLLRDILEKTDHELRRLTEASERAMELAGAVQFTDALFEETEEEIRRLYESVPVSVGEAAASPGGWEYSAQVAMARGLAERSITVPEWLSRAAERFFQEVNL